MYTGKITPRRVGVLVANLPAGASLYQALESDNSWQPEALLLAGVFDILNAAHTSSKTAPAPVQRPGDVRREREQAEQVATRANQFMARRARRAELLRQQASAEQSDEGGLDGG